MILVLESNENKVLGRNVTRGSQRRKLLLICCRSQSTRHYIMQERNGWMTVFEGIQWYFVQFVMDKRRDL